MSDQQEGLPTPEADPIFKLGQKVLIDEGPKGPHRIDSIEPGMLPAVGENLEATEKTGYWYVVSRDGGEPYRAAELNLMLVSDQLPALECIDGRFYTDGREISREEAIEAGWKEDFNEPSEAPPEPETANGGSASIEGPESVEDRLRAGYKAGQGERRKTLEIAPGRYHDLAAEFKPVDWDLRRRLIRQANRKGESGTEADMRINSALMAGACVSMLFRPAPGQGYAPLHTLAEKFKGGEPIRFDTRLAEILGMELIGGESEADICRLVFGDPGIFEAHYMMLSGWSLQAFEDDEEEDEGGDRPT